jgi:hypothetical protein
MVNGTKLSLLLILALTIRTSVAYTHSDVNTLYASLTSGYNKEIRPEVDQSLVTEVTASFNPISLQDIDEVDGTVTITGFFTLSWTDHNLIWNPGTYQGISFIDLPHDSVWKPPVVNGNSVKQLKILTVSDMQVQVRNDGTVTFYPGDSFTFTCDIDSSHFPFDSQVCKMDMLSWGHSESTMRFTPGTIFTDLLASNSKWEITNAKIYNATYGALKIAGFNLNFTFKRRSFFFVINLLLPVDFLGFLNIFVFVLPQDSGERIGFCITALLAVVVFLTIAQGLLPSTATPRLASMYELLIQNMSLSGCIVVSVIVGSWIYHRSDDTPIPNWIRKLVNCVCCKRKTTNGGTSLNEKNVVHSLDESTNGVTNDVIDQNLTWKNISNYWDITSFWFYLLWFIVGNVKYFIDTN